MGKLSELDCREVSGAFLLAIVGSFEGTRSLPIEKASFDLKSINPSGWYSYSKLIELFRIIESIIPESGSILFWAGVKFVEIWYWSGPGKELIHSSMDWLYINRYGDGYKSVVRGGSPDEIGWVKMLSIDETEGIVIYEDVSLQSGKYLEGIFYGGCLLFDDMAYVSVTTSDTPYKNNSDLIHSIITIKFVQKIDNSLSYIIEKDKDIDISTISQEQINDLFWCYKGLNNLEKHKDSYRKELVCLFQDSLDKVNLLSGLLPICSHCKKIRDDKGYWNQLETYIDEHSEVEFSHGICQECAKKYYPGLGLYDDE